MPGCSPDRHSTNQIPRTMIERTSRPGYPRTVRVDPPVDRAAPRAPAGRTRAGFAWKRRGARMFLAHLALAGTAGFAYAAEAPADALLRELSLPEKIAQMQEGAPAVPRLGLPAYAWWNEGLHGLARAGQATVFPQAIGMAASWDAPLLQEVGSAIAAQARANFARAAAEPSDGLSRNAARYRGLTIWSPNINIFRDPRWGRGQETYGEDPELTARLGVAFIQGLQGPDP